MLELTRITAAMSCITKLTFNEKRSFVEDLNILYSRKEDMTYLPNKELIKGLYPAKDY